MNCREFDEIADSYLSDELLVETNHEVLRHLETCANCRRDFSARRELRMLVRSAVRTSPEMQINAAFRAKLIRQLKNSDAPVGFWEKIKNAVFFNFKFAALAATLLVIFSLFAGYLLRRPASDKTLQAVADPVNSPVNSAPSTPIPQVAFAAWRESVQKAVGDHLNCAVKFNLAEKPISLDKAAVKYGKFNKNIDKTVMTSFDQSPARPSPEKIELLEAHSCLFQGIRFAHIVLRYHQNIVSVLVSEPESTTESNNAIITQTEGAVHAASFQAANHLVYVVSQLSEAENLAIARQIQPSVKRHIEQNAI